jgi:hypothetical protein
MPSREHLAWLAGLFEGEGCIAAPYRRADNRKSSPLRIRIKMCDKDVLQKFKTLAGMGGVSGPYKPSGWGVKPTFDYVISGRKAYALAAMLWTYLGQRRKSQVRRAFRAYAKISSVRKLTYAQVEDIKRALHAGQHGINRQLAKKYGVTDGMISALKHNRLWKDPPRGAHL